MERALIEQKLKAACELGLALAAERSSIDSVYVAGSLTAGLGNPTSDADLFVLVDADAVSPAVTQYNIGGHRVDAEWFTLTEARAIVDEVIGFRLHREDLARLRKLATGLDFVARLNSSQSIVASPGLADLRNSVADSLHAVTRLAMNNAAIAVNGYLEDFVGAVADDDLETAAFAGQGLVAHAGKAVTAASGDLYYSTKWVYKQLSRIPLQGFPMQRFTDFQKGVWTAGGQRAAADLMFFAQSSLVASHLMGHAGVSLEHWPCWEANERPDGVWRNPAFSVLRVDEGVLLHRELNRQVVLKEHVAFVWALCNGRPVDAIAADVERLAEVIPTLKDLTESRVAGIVAALTSKDLVSTARHALFTVA
ncbi:nucleotidyltransferase domain-containing protein [Actinoplanes sp. ATCC 53533]|uniref:nucleotidyltransferase domain-containing protein n=1 Tax=Actinoplanes sp. ATCC 53533 TaxID=1288362 RepID=UPI0013151E87|nr:nucleotidyltransferase domain-containing protein [Actinoplanes sp. ATCC 53533]